MRGWSRRSFLELTAAAAVVPAALRAAKPSAESATTVAAEIAAGRISSLEAVERSIERIESRDHATNAIVVHDFERARASARKADAAIARGERKPLLGVPMTVKESFDIAGLPSSWGMPQFAHQLATRDAAAVARLKAAGAIVLGKSNLHFQIGLFHGARVPMPLHDWQSFNPVYGTTNNPWDLGRTPGGSSGGAAAALSAGYIPLELGSDIGGSIRAPANFCGVYGHKPTSGLVSGEGHDLPGMSGPPPPFPFFDMAAYGPMARRAADLNLALGILAQQPLPQPRHERLSDYRILLLDTHPLMPVSSAVRTLVGARGRALEHAGVQVARASELLPDLARSARAYMQALSGFDRLAWPPSVVPILQHAAAQLDPTDEGLAAYRLRGALIGPKEFAKLAEYRSRLRSEWQRLFGEFDVLLCPIMPTTAYPHDHSDDEEARIIAIDGRPRPYMDQLFWPGVATFPGLPATALPLGLARDGLPAGAQAIGPWLSDRTTIRFAELMEREFGPPPLPA